MSRPRTTRVNAVVWDLGGVLIGWDPRVLYRRLLASDDKVEAYLAEVDFAGWNRLQDAGRPMADGVAELSARFPHRRGLVEAYPVRYAETLLGPVPGSVELLDEMRRRGGVRLLALTNWSADTFHHARDGYPFLTWFEAVVVSGEERLAKPDPRLFRRVLQRYRLDPATTVYVDDAPANVVAASALGLIAVRFTGAEDLRTELAALGLVAAAPS